MKTTELIENLSKEASAVKTLPPFAVFARWVLFLVVYAAVMLIISHIRSDVMIRLQDPLFLSEVVSLLATTLTVSIASIILSYPDNYQKKYLIYLPILPLAAFIVTLCLEFRAESQASAQIGHGLECFLCICAFACMPALILLKYMRKNASTSPRLATAMGMLAAFSLGALIIRLSEKTDSMQHLIEAHYLPLVAITSIGLLAGRKLLKW